MVRWHLPLTGQHGEGFCGINPHGVVEKQKGCQCLGFPQEKEGRGLGQASLLLGQVLRKKSFHS